VLAPCSALDGRQRHDAATSNLALACDVTAWPEILNAHKIPARRAQTSGWIDVRARLVWERDGEEFLELARSRGRGTWSSSSSPTRVTCCAAFAWPPSDVVRR